MAEIFVAKHYQKIFEVKVIPCSVKVKVVSLPLAVRKNKVKASDTSGITCGLAFRTSKDTPHDCSELSKHVHKT